MSGTEKEVDFSEKALARLEKTFDRQWPLKSLDALYDCLAKRLDVSVPLGEVALGFDTNVFLTVNNNPDRSDILDYLAKHPGPIVIPGQAVQEFWNNAYNGITTFDKVIKQRFDSLERELLKAGVEFSEFKDGFDKLLEDFKKKFGYVYDQSTKHKIEGSVDIFRNVAITEYVPRGRFRNIAADRKITKTPPGFKDAGNGDFYIWADFLYSLLLHRSVDKPFNRIAFITDDVKADWSIRGTPHPILRAEVTSLLGVDLEIWTLDEFARLVRAVT